MDAVLKNWRVLAFATLAFPFTSSASLGGGDSLYAADNGNGPPGSSFSGSSILAEINADSLLVTGSFLTPVGIEGVAADGTHVFVSSPTGLSEYTTAGAFLGSFPTRDPDALSALALSGDTLYAADNGNGPPGSSFSGSSIIAEINADSLLVTGSFLTPVGIEGVAADGTHVFVSSPTGISEYTTAGAFLGSFPTRDPDALSALALSGDTLYAADNGNGPPGSSFSGSSIIAEINTDSLLVTGSFLTPVGIEGVAADGANVFVSSPTGISEYTTAGVLLGSFPTRDPDSLSALALVTEPSPAVPEAPTWAMMALGFAGLRFAGYWRGRRTATA